MSADLQALATGNGMSGQAPQICPYCTGDAASSKLQWSTDQALPEQRTLESIKTDYLKAHATHSKTKTHADSPLLADFIPELKAGGPASPKPVNGISHLPLFRLPITRWVPAFLHVMMGTVQTMLDLVVKEAEDLDIQKYGEIIEVSDALSNLKSGYDRGVMLALRRAMNDAGASFTVYFGGTLVGNHVGKLLRGQEEFLQRIAVQIQLDHGSSRSQAFLEKHADLWACVAGINSLVRSARQLTEKEICHLEVECPRFGNLFRKKFPTRTNKGKALTPKMHILECHIPIFVRKYGTVGWLGEDGVEHLHKIHKVLERRTIFVKDPQKRVEAEQRLEVQRRTGAVWRANRKKRAKGE